MPYLLFGAVVGAVMFAVTLILILMRYKRCPSNKILVKWGKVGMGAAGVTKSSTQIHGGATFVWPVIQAYGFLSLEPLNTDIDLKGALSKQNIRVNVPSSFTFAIGTTPELMASAADRLLGMKSGAIISAAREIIFGQLRATIATMNIEDINGNREAFEKAVLDNIDTEMRKIGLYLINVNISDITDESGYLEALGQEAASRVVADAQIKVAANERNGAIGAANAKAEERTKVAEAEAVAVQGENLAAVVQANSTADRQVAEAEAKRKSDAAEAVQAASALAEGFAAEKDAEAVRAERDRATQFADEVVPAQIAADKALIEAGAAKKVEVLEGEARGDARKAELEGEAAGLKSIVVAAASDPDKAAMLLIVQKLDRIAELQAQAISNIDFEKIVVYDGGGSYGQNGSTARFMQDLTKMLPQLHEFAKMAGVTLPNFLGETLADSFDMAAQDKTQLPTDQGNLQAADGTASGVQS